MPKSDDPDAVQKAAVFFEKAKKNYEAARWAVRNGNYCAAANRHYYALIQAVRAKLEGQSASVEEICKEKAERFRGKGLRNIGWNNHEVIVTPEAMSTAGLPVECHKTVYMAWRYRVDSDYKPFMVSPDGVKRVDAESGVILKLLGVRI